MMKLIAAFSMLLFSNLASAHDHSGMSHLVFANGALHAHATWVKGPQVADESVLRLEWKNGTNHTPTEPPGNFEVVLWMSMSGKGHGSAPTQIMRVLDPNGQIVVGTYDVTGMYFVMGGDWQVNVTLNFPNGTKETQTINLNIKGDHHH